MDSQTYSLQTAVENNFETCGKNTKSMFKKQLFSITQDSSLSRRKWTEEERNFLDSFLSEAGVVPSSGAGAFWEECAEKLNAQCSSARTGSYTF